MEQQPHSQFVVLSALLLTDVFLQQTPPVKLNEEQRAHLEGFKGGFLSFILHPSHVISEVKREELIWSLLTFYSFLAYHVRSFKVGSPVPQRGKTNAE